MPLDAHYLEVFKAVLVECSMTQAAARLRTSASNVKRIVSVLERELGVPLFEREMRGQFQPTPHATRLNREMDGFMKEMESLQQLVEEIHLTGRVLKVGVPRWFFETSYFVTFFNLLRQDPRVRPMPLKIEDGRERAMLESGACDVCVGAAVTGGRRLAAVPVGELPWTFGTLDPEIGRLDATGLAGLRPKGLHVPGRQPDLRKWRRLLELVGAAGSCTLATPHYREWALSPADAELKGVVSPEPAQGAADPRLHWHSCSFLPSIPIRATFLAQHPYGFLGSAVQRAGARLKSP